MLKSATPPGGGRNSINGSDFSPHWEIREARGVQSITKPSKDLSRSDRVVFSYHKSNSAPGPLFKKNLPPTDILSIASAV